MTGKLVCLETCESPQACPWKNVEVEVIDLKKGKFKLLKPRYPGQTLIFNNHHVVTGRGLLLCQVDGI